MTLPPESYHRRAKAIFEEIVDLPPAERDEAAARLAEGDEAVLAEVRSLLAAHDEAEAFMQDPTVAPTGEAGVGIGEFEVVGSRIGHYHLLERLGEGGFGVVYLAEQERPVRRQVALKLIKLGMDTRQVVARFEVERQALAMMDHPNIARVFDAGATDTGRPYFVMELVKGVPITTWCDERRLPLRARLELFAGVCQAVQHAHQKGIIHRDIKPSNVLVTIQDERPVAKVIDFGIAKATDARLTERTLFTEQRQLVGTPEYMSPEQAEMAGAAADIDTRSDIYSLGVLLYELLTGTTPFEARELRSKAFAEMQRTIREVDPPRPSTRLSELRGRLPTVAAQRNTEPARLSSSIRGELDWIVMKCIEKDRSRRYQTPAALAADLAHYLADEPVSAAAPSRSYLLRKFARRHRVAIGTAGAVAAAIVLGLVLATFGLVEARRERDAALVAQTQALEAQRQAELSRAAEAEAREYERQTDTFLREMFESIEPARAQGQPVLVREILDAATQRLDAQPPDHPIVEASLRYTFGRAYANLGLLDVARRQLERAAELYEASKGAGDASTARTRSILGMVYLRQGQYELAEATLRRVADTWRGIGGPDDPETISAESLLAEVLNRRGDIAGAEAILTQLLPRVRQAKGNDSDDVLVVLDSIASLRIQQGSFQEAEAAYREALDTARHAHGDSHPFTIAFAANLGNLLRTTGRFEEAIELLHASRDAAVSVFGPDHPDSLAAGNNLGLMLQAAGRLEEARAVFEDVLERRRRLFGEDHPGTLTSRANRALLLQALRQFDEARAEITGVIEARRRLLGPDHPDTLLLASNLGWLHVQAGRPAEAEAVLSELLPRVRTALGEEHPIAVVTAMRLGYSLLHQDRAAEAEPLFKEAHAGSQRVGLPQPPYAQGHGMCLLKLGRADEALPLLLVAAAAYEARPPVDREAHRQLLQAIVTTHESLGNLDEVDAWRRRMESLEDSTTQATQPNRS